MDTTSIITSPEYAELLLKARPSVIKTRKQFDRFVDIMETIDAKPDPTLQEEVLSELLMSLIGLYEKDAVTRLPPNTPLEVLKYLMRKGGLSQADLLPVFGSRSVASQTLSGKRGLSVPTIVKLADYFNVSPALFIDGVH